MPRPGWAVASIAGRGSVRKGRPPHSRKPWQGRPWRPNAYLRSPFTGLVMVAWPPNRGLPATAIGASAHPGLRASLAPLPAPRSTLHQPRNWGTDYLLNNVAGSAIPVTSTEFFFVRPVWVRHSARPVGAAVSGGSGNQGHSRFWILDLRFRICPCFLPLASRSATHYQPPTTHHPPTTYHLLPTAYRPSSGTTGRTALE